MSQYPNHSTNQYNDSKIQTFIPRSFQSMYVSDDTGSKNNQFNKFKPEHQFDPRNTMQNLNPSGFTGVNAPVPTIQSINTHVPAPTTQGFNTSTTQGFNAPATQGFNAPTTQGFNAPTTQGFDAPTTQGFNAPTTQGFNAPTTQGFNAPTTQGFNAPTTQSIKAPTTQGFNAPAPVPVPKGFNAPACIPHNFNSPTIPGFNVPSPATRSANMSPMNFYHQTNNPLTEGVNNPFTSQTDFMHVMNPTSVHQGSNVPVPGHYDIHNARMFDGQNKVNKISATNSSILFSDSNMNHVPNMNYGYNMNNYSNMNRNQVQHSYNKSCEITQEPVQKYSSTYGVQDRKHQSKVMSSNITRVMQSNMPDEKQTHKSKASMSVKHQIEKPYFESDSNSESDSVSINGYSSSSEHSQKVHVHKKSKNTINTVNISDRVDDDNSDNSDVDKKHFSKFTHHKHRKSSPKSSYKSSSHSSHESSPQASHEPSHSSISKHESESDSSDISSDDELVEIDPSDYICYSQNVKCCICRKRHNGVLLVQICRNGHVAAVECLKGILDSFLKDPNPPTNWPECTYKHCNTNIWENIFGYIGGNYSNAVGEKSACLLTSRGENYVYVPGTNLKQNNETCITCPHCKEPMFWDENSSPSTSFNCPLGKPLDYPHLQHFNKHRCKCPYCSKDFCRNCNEYPYHYHYNCSEFKDHKESSVCKHCNKIIPKGQKQCKNPECIELECSSCQCILPCGHKCGGVLGEKTHPHCLESECRRENDPVSNNDDCVLCAGPLNEEPIIELSCHHFFHYRCICKQIKNASSSNRAIPSGYRCSYCRKVIDHPLLKPLLKHN